MISFDMKCPYCGNVKCLSEDTDDYDENVVQAITCYKCKKDFYYEGVWTEDCEGVSSFQIVTSKDDDE